MYTNEQMYGLITKPEPENISRYDLINKPEPDELYHWGVKGMKWGVRRYRNKDGTLTEEGKRRQRRTWMNDPREFARHYDELTEDERRYAIKKRKDIREFVGQDNKGKKKSPVKSTKEFLNDVGTIGASLLAVHTFVNSKEGKEMKAKALRWIKRTKKWVME